MEMGLEVVHGDGDGDVQGGSRLAAIMSNGSNAWNLFTCGASLPASDIVLHSPQLRAAHYVCSMGFFIQIERETL